MHRTTNDVELQDNVAYHTTAATNKKEAKSTACYEEVLVGRRTEAQNEGKEPMYEEVMPAESRVAPAVPAEEHQYEEPM